jgi:hypothetical protein
MAATWRMPFQDELRALGHKEIASGVDSQIARASNSVNYTIRVKASANNNPLKPDRFCCALRTAFPKSISRTHACSNVDVQDRCSRLEQLRVTLRKYGC